MNQRLSIAAATAALAALPLLAACGGGTTAPPAGSTAPSQAAPSASTEPAASPTSSPTSTFDKSKESKAVTEATQKFGAAVLTLSYTDDSIDDYLKRIKPLTTAAGYAEVKSEAKESDFAKILKTLKAGKARSVSSVTGDVKVEKVDAKEAETSFKFGAKIQQKSGGGWKTVRTTPAESGRLDLVNENGTWLVNHLPPS